MAKDDDQYSDYIDNEILCMLKGVPCLHGIPCCSCCRQPDITNTNLNEEE